MHAMLYDARQIARGAILNADLVIIGAGPAGIAIAREFIGSRRKVIVLEGGGLEMDPESQALYRGENVGRPYLPLEALRSRYFGGASNCWGGWCRPLDSIDFEKRCWVHFSGWPFKKAALDPYYERAHSLCGLGPYEYDDLLFWEQRLNHPRLKPLHLSDSRVFTKIAQLSQHPRFGVVYREELARAENVEIYLHANVIEVVTDETATIVTGLRVATISGLEFRVEARQYILATGGIENARLLLVSNRVAQAGLGNQHDLVGRFFMEHPDVRLSELALEDSTAAPDLYDVQYAFFHAPAVACLALRDEVQREERLLNYQAWIIAVHIGEHSRGGEALKSLYRAIRKPTLPDHFMDTDASFWMRNVAHAILDFPNTASVALGRLTGSPRFVEKRVLAHYCEPAPNPASRITLATERDRLGLNRVRLDWRFSELDRHTIRRAEEIISEEMKRVGVGRVISGIGGNDSHAWLDDSLWGWHQMGTTRMHEDPRQGVVDPDCKVHGMANLYIAGSSIFPTGGSNLPTLTIVALALRLADHLRSILRV
jgi:choline dehydrogenase-like flavoprotein